MKKAKHLKIVLGVNTIEIRLETIDNLGHIFIDDFKTKKILVEFVCDNEIGNEKSVLAEYIQNGFERTTANKKLIKQVKDRGLKL